MLWPYQCTVPSDSQHLHTRVTVCLQEQTRFLMTHFPQALIDVAWFSLLGAIGQLFIFYSISEFGTLVTTTICITRCVARRTVHGEHLGHPRDLPPPRSLWQYSRAALGDSRVPCRVLPWLAPHG